MMQKFLGKFWNIWIKKKMQSGRVKKSHFTMPKSMQRYERLADVMACQKEMRCFLMRVSCFVNWQKNKILLL